MKVIMASKILLTQNCLGNDKLLQIHTSSRQHFSRPALYVFNQSKYLNKKKLKKKKLFPLRKSYYGDYIITYAFKYSYIFLLTIN